MYLMKKYFIRRMQLVFACDLSFVITTNLVANVAHD
jgi:hypothetical protein